MPPASPVAPPPPSQSSGAHENPCSPPPDPDHVPATLFTSSASASSLVGPVDGGGGADADRLGHHRPDGVPPPASAFARAKALALEKTAKLRESTARLSELGKGKGVKSRPEFLSGGGSSGGRSKDGAADFGTASAGSLLAPPGASGAAAAASRRKSLGAALENFAFKPRERSSSSGAEGRRRLFGKEADGNPGREEPPGAAEGGGHAARADAEGGGAFVDVDVSDGVLPGPRGPAARDAAAAAAAAAVPRNPGDRPPDARSLNSVASPAAAAAAAPLGPASSARAGGVASGGPKGRLPLVELRSAVSFGDLIALSSGAPDSGGRDPRERAHSEELRARSGNQEEAGGRAPPAPGELACAQ